MRTYRICGDHFWTFAVTFKGQMAAGDIVEVVVREACEWKNA